MNIKYIKLNNEMSVDWTTFRTDRIVLFGTLTANFIIVSPIFKKTLIKLIQGHSRSKIQKKESEYDKPKLNHIHSLLKMSVKTTVS